MGSAYWDSGFRQTAGSRKAHRHPTGVEYFHSIVNMYLYRKIPAGTMIDMIQKHYYDQNPESPDFGSVWLDWDYLADIFYGYREGLVNDETFREQMTKYKRERFQ